MKRLSLPQIAYILTYQMTVKARQIQGAILHNDYKGTMDYILSRLFAVSF